MIINKISYKSQKLFYFIFFLLLCLYQIGCSRSSTHQQQSAIKSIIINPVQIDTHIGNITIITAVGVASDGNLRDITLEASWQTENSNIAKIGACPVTIDNSLCVTAINAGTTNITASLNGVTGSSIVNVNDSSIKSISITPNPINIHINNYAVLSAKALYFDGSTEDITLESFWQSNNPNIAQIDSCPAENIDNPFCVKGVSPGTTTINASLNGVTGSATVQVKSAVLQSIQITPSIINTHVGNFEIVTATGLYSDGSSEDITLEASWKSISPAIALITECPAIIDSPFCVKGVSAGTTAIIASLGSVSSETEVSVSSALLKSITVTPNIINTHVGNFEVVTATGLYSDGSSEDVSIEALWQSANSNIAIIDYIPQPPDFIIENVVVKGVRAGNTTITASLNGITSLPVAVTVSTASLQSITVTPSIINTHVGNFEVVTATGVYSDGSSEDISMEAFWQSANLNIATIDYLSQPPGLNTEDVVVKGVSAGNTTITASLNGITSSPASVSVSNAILQSITITPTNPFTIVGDTEQFTATGGYSDGSTEDITNEVTWSSSQTGVATISNVVGSNGLATAIKEGSTTIIAQAMALQISGSTNLTVGASANGFFAYVVNGVGASMSMYSINSSIGQLAALSPPIIATGNSPKSMVITNSGNYAYAVNGNNIYMYGRNKTTGQLTALYPPFIPVSSTCYTVAITPSDAFVYVPCNGNIYIFQTNSSTGQLTASNPASVPASFPLAMTISPSGTLAYVIDYVNQTVLMFSINIINGQLVPLSPATIATGSGPYTIAVDPFGYRAYVSNKNSNNISIYNIDPATGVLSATFTVNVSNPSVFAITPSGKYFYVVNASPNNTISMYSVALANGQLFPLSPATVITGNNPTAIAIDPTEKYLYVTNGNDNTVSMYSINSTNGQLTVLFPASIKTEASPNNIIIK